MLLFVRRVATALSTRRVEGTHKAFPMTGIFLPHPALDAGNISFYVHAVTTVDAALADVKGKERNTRRSLWRPIADKK